jgi:hypothetical protein
MENFTLKAALKMMGVSYLGNVAHSAKMSASFRNGTMTYCIYLAPWNMSGHNVCPNGQHCHKNCLVKSGREKIKEFTDGENNAVLNARIRKTNFFYENRETFMQVMIHEIKMYQRRAQKMNMEFSVRINGTSDLSPILFKDPISGKNILELFPNVQFYDYTKNVKRIELMDIYPNYDVTFSFDGYNHSECEEFLKRGGKVAVVFYGGLPKTYKGYKVVDANQYDMRYLDPKGCIMGLHYHVTANDYYINNSGKREFREPNTPFVVKIG